MSNHEKAYLICENKCLVEGVTKENFERLANIKENPEQLIGFDERYERNVYKKVFSDATLTKQGDDYTTALEFEHMPTLIMDSYAVIKSVGAGHGGYTANFKKVPLETTITGSSTSVTCNVKLKYESNEDELYNVDLYFIYNSTN